jgi:hypothetical protein
MTLTAHWLTVAVLAAGAAGACRAQDYMALSLEELMQVDVAVASRISRSVDR